MVATWNRAADHDYYLRQAEYYLGGREPEGQWRTTTGDFGVVHSTSVERKDFRRLYAGLDDTDRSLLSKDGGRLDRVPAFDICFSAPKPVSIAWAIANTSLRAQIEVAQARAVEAALAMLDNNAAFCRRGRGGAVVERVRLTAAIFPHGESRPAEHSDGRVFADPNLHTHAVCMNLATRRDGSVGALHSTVLRDYKMAAGAVYHAALAHELEALGFGIAGIGYNGTFELDGIPSELITYFSARRNDIAAELEEAGSSTAQAPQLAAAVARVSRKAKIIGENRDRFALWAEAVEERGLAVETLVEHLRPQALGPHRQKSEELLSERIACIGDELTSNESTFKRQDLLRAVASAFVGSGLPAARIDLAADGLISSGRIVEIRRDALNYPVYSTPEMIRIEQELLAKAERLAAQPWLSLNEEVVKTLCEAHGLNTEQTIAALDATKAKAIAITEGAAGAGKTTTLKTVVAAYQLIGCRVIGATTAWRTARMLRQQLGIEARATASWLARAEVGTPFLDRNTVLIVDEAGQLGSRSMHALLTSAEKAGAKIILTGDRQQIQAIDAGPGLAIVGHAVQGSRIDTIVRQRDAWMREAVECLSRGDIEPALASIDEHGCITECDGTHATIVAAVDAWIEAKRRAPEQSHLLLAKTNANVRALNLEVRRRLRGETVLIGEDHTIVVETNSGHVAKLPLAIGDSVRFIHRDDRLGVINGTPGTIERLEPDSDGHLSLSVRVDGRDIVFSTRDLANEAGHIRLAHNFATSVYASQGLTVDTATILLDPSYNRHDIYVAVSRARAATQLIVDNKALDLQVAAARPADDRERAVTEAERYAFLVSRLSREHIKTTTLDIAPPRSQAAAERMRENQQGPRHSNELSLE